MRAYAMRKLEEFCEERMCTSFHVYELWLHKVRHTPRLITLIKKKKIIVMVTLVTWLLTPCPA